MKSIAVTLIVVNLSYSLVFADESPVCPREPGKSYGKCEKLAVPFFGSASGLLYAARKSTQAKFYEYEHNREIFADRKDGLNGQNLNQINEKLSHLEKGDRVTILYRIEPDRHRGFYLERITNEQNKSIELKRKYEAHLKSQVGSGHAQEWIRLIDQEAKKIERLGKVIAAVKQGAPVPIANLKEVIDVTGSNATQISDFNRTVIDHGGTVQSIRHFPSRYVSLMKKARAISRGGMAAATVGGLIMLEAMFEDEADSNAEAAPYVPEIQSRPR